MKNFFLVTLLLTQFHFSNGQFFFHKQWDKRYGGSKHDGLIVFVETSDEGFLLTGTSESDISGDKTEGCLGGFDYWIVKINASGNKEWDKTLGGTGEDAIQGLAIAKDGGYLLGGNSNSGTGGDKSENSRGGYDFWVVKIDSTGLKKWDKTFGGISSEDGPTIISCKDGGFILSGMTTSGLGGDKTEASWGDYDLWVVKIDSTGLKKWDKRYGGTDRDLGAWAIEAVNDGYLIAGISQSDSSGDISENNRGFSDYWVVKVDSSGNKVWDKRFGGSGEEILGAVVTNEAGEFFIAGSSGSPISGDKTQNPIGSSDYWTVKVDSVGVKKWDKVYGGLDGDDLWATFKTSDGGYLLSGPSESNAGGDKTENNLGIEQIWIVKVDSMFNKQWDKTIFTNGGFQGGYALQTMDGCYAAGVSSSSGVGGYKTQPNWDATEQTSDYWIMKFCIDTVSDLSPALSVGEGVVQVYPNPFSGDLSIYVQKENLREATFTISDVMGNVVYRKEENNLSDSYTKMLDLSPLAKGVYFVEVRTENGSEVKRIIKE